MKTRDKIKPGKGEIYTTISIISLCAFIVFIAVNM